MQHFVQPIVTADFGGAAALGDLLATLAQLESTVHNVLAKINGRVEEEKQKVDAVSVRLTSCRGRLHGLAQQRYNKATIVSSPSRYPAPKELPEPEPLFATTANERSASGGAPVSMKEDATDKKPRSSAPQPFINKVDPLSLDDEVGLTFEKEQPTKKSLKSDDPRADTARLRGLTSVGDLLVFSPSHHRGSARKSGRSVVDQKLGAAPATISGDFSWDVATPREDLRHHPVMLPIRLRTPRNLVGLSMVAQDIAFALPSVSELSAAQSADYEDLPLPEFADDKYFPSRVVRGVVLPIPVPVPAPEVFRGNDIDAASVPRHQLPAMAAVASAEPAVILNPPEASSAVALATPDELPEFDLTPNQVQPIERSSNDGDGNEGGATHPRHFVAFPPIPRPPTPPPERRTASTARTAAAREERAAPNEERQEDRSLADILREEFAKRFDRANGRSTEQEAGAETEGNHDGGGDYDEWDPSGEEWQQHEGDHQTLDNLHPFF